MRFGVLGPVAAWTDDGVPVRIPDRKVRALLADLLLHAGRPVAAPVLIDDLWGDALPANPTATLQTRVSQLRRALDEAEPGARNVVRTQPPGYLIAIPQEAVDAGRFRMLVTRARQTGNAQMRVATLADALGMWRGPAYADVAEEPFARPVIDRLTEERLAVQEAYAEARLELGEHEDLVVELVELVARHPVRQRLRAVHLRALYRAGRQADALESYAELRRSLADELGLDPNPELIELHQAILTEDPALASPAPSNRRTNIPARVAPFVGRTGAIAEVAGKLDDARLVTLSGAGGVGKTSLALAVARELNDVYPGGAWLAELAALSTSAGPDDVATVVSAAVGGDGRSVARGDAVLVVLDNCEHVVDAAAAAASRLLLEQPDLRILATSREPLAVGGEQRLSVPPLELPDPGMGVDEIKSAPAAQLFVARARAADPTFTLTDANAGAVVEICHRLDGLPLALELAASRASAMDVAELAARLDDRFRLLANRRRDAPERQQTLLAMVEWSWNLLTHPEQAVLRRLALHPGGCTLAAAEAVCVGGDVQVSDVADVLGRLVERSLVVRSNATSGSRYRLLETVRAFSLARLEEAGELADTRRRYERYFEALATNTEPRLYGHSELFAYLGGLYGAPVASSASPGRGRQTGQPHRGDVYSADGTRLAVERFGDGAPIVLVGGALNDRRTFVPLARRLARRLTAITYDRRGRGESESRVPHSVQCEIEDLAAVVDSVDGEPYMLGVSSGAVLAAEAAAHGVPVRGLVLIEPPFILDDSRSPMPTDFATQLENLVAAGRPGDAVELFLVTAVEMPAEVVAPMRTAPMWRDLEALAPTLANDIVIMGDFRIPPHWPSAITVPVLILDGEQSHEWRRDAAQEVADALPQGRRMTMAGHPHDVEPEVLGPIVDEFTRAVRPDTVP